MSSCLPCTHNNVDTVSVINCFCKYLNTDFKKNLFRSAQDEGSNGALRFLGVRGLNMYLRRKTSLKLLTNEKRGGLRVILFYRSPFKLFSRKFSKESVQAPSFERPRTAPRTLFVSFAINNCFQISVQHRSYMKKIRETCMPRGEFKYR